MSLLLFFLFISLTSIQAGDLNVGTTLFTKADTCKECWSSESLALLTSRMILEDLLPSTSILVIDSNEFVTDLVEYFRLILEIVRKETRGKTKHITLLALTDLLGGYLYHAVLPIAKYAYYAGLIDYDSMATLLGLYDELKWFLRTNGQGWAKPMTQTIENFEIQKLPLQQTSENEQCDNLLFIENENSHANDGHCNGILPLPFFDSITQPSAIALPTKMNPLHNLEANGSSYLVMHFFLMSYKCLELKNVKHENLEKYQNDFSGWIDEQVMPRLGDEKFYAAFGGVLRVSNTLKRLGVSENNAEKQIDQSHETNLQLQNTNLAPTNRQMTKASMILTAVLITLFVWFLLGTLFICYKMKQTKQAKVDGEEASPGAESDEKTTTCSSLVSSKYFYPEKLKVLKCKKGDCSPSADTDESDGGKKYRRGRRQITITTCRCKPDDDDDEDIENVARPKTLAITESSPPTTDGDGRLPSITEMSETTSTQHQTRSSTSRSSMDAGRTQVQKGVYLTESETEETSEPP